jgi:hypothetical protein
MDEEQISIDQFVDLHPVTEGGDIDCWTGKAQKVLGATCQKCPAFDGVHNLPIGADHSCLGFYKYHLNQRIAKRLDII